VSAVKQIKMSDKILPAFREFWRSSRNNDYLFYVLKGGRASSKSTHIAIDMIYDLMRKPVNMLAIRKVGNTLQDSVYEQLLWAIEYLEVSHLFKVNKSPLKITYRPRGNAIIFRGADDPAKIKSIKSSKFPIAVAWFEEIAEFKTEDEISTIVNSIVRAELDDGLKYKIYMSYNPPKRKQSWVNKKFETKFVSKNTYVHHSTYLDNPHVSKAFIEEAEEVREKRPNKYEWEYLGKPIGSGVVPFDNLIFREITNDEVKRFDNIRQGIDWGYATDAFAFGRMHYDKTRRTLYIVDEYYKVKASNREVAEWIIKKGYTDAQIIADGAEPKSVDELRDLGIKRIKGSVKGAGSVEYGEKWLDDLDGIVIDYKRTPNAAREFENIDYQTDKDGNPRARLEDKDNHFIDQVRYALEDDMRTRKPMAVGRSITR